MPHKAHVVHRTKGRVRIKVPHAKNRPALVHHLARTLEGMDGVKSAEGNPVTGSILMHHEGHSDRNFMEKLADFAERSHLFGLDTSDLSDIQQFAGDVRTEVEYLRTHSTTAQRIIDEVDKVNTGIKRATDNNLDLNVLLPLGVALTSGAAIGLNVPTPLWITLAIFSFHSFVSLHSSSTKLESPEQRPRSPQENESRLSVQ